MSVAQVSLALAIYSCPGQQKAQVENISELFKSAKWTKQDLLADTFTVEFNLNVETLVADQIISALTRVSGLHFEAMQNLGNFGQLFMFVPGLGMYRADTNGAGEILVSEDRIRNVMEQSTGNSREMQRLIRLLLGQAWDDVLEPFRAQRYNQNIALLHKAV